MHRGDHDRLHSLTRLDSYPHGIIAASVLAHPSRSKRARQRSVWAYETPLRFASLRAVAPKGRARRAFKVAFVPSLSPTSGLPCRATVAGSGSTSQRSTVGVRAGRDRSRRRSRTSGCSPRMGLSSPATLRAVTCDTPTTAATAAAVGSSISTTAIHSPGLSFVECSDVPVVTVKRLRQSRHRHPRHSERPAPPGPQRTLPHAGHAGFPSQRASAIRVSALDRITASTISSYPTLGILLSYANNASPVRLADHAPSPYRRCLPGCGPRGAGLASAGPGSLLH